MHLGRWIPLLGTLQTYQRSWLRADLIAELKAELKARQSRKPARTSRPQVCTA